MMSPSLLKFASYFMKFHVSIFLFFFHSLNILSNFNRALRTFLFKQWHEIPTAEHLETIRAHVFAHLVRTQTALDVFDDLNGDIRDPGVLPPEDSSLVANPEKPYPKLFIRGMLHREAME